MKEIISSQRMGNFIFDEATKAYRNENKGIHWSLNMSQEGVDAQLLLQKAETLFADIEQFEQKAKRAIAEKLVNYKNEFWPEYDEENVDWDAVDAGEYEVTTEAFEAAIALCDVDIRIENIYCEYKDGDLFGGHRIHAYFDDDYKLIRADV